MLILAQAKLPQWFNDAASLASVMSLIVSIYVAVKVRDVAQHYVQLALIPKLGTQLRACMKNLIEQNQQKDWEGLKGEAVAVKVIASQVVAITKGELRTAAEAATTAAKALIDEGSANIGTSKIERLRLSLKELDVHLAQFLEVKKWRK